LGLWASKAKYQVLSIRGLSWRTALSNECRQRELKELICGYSEGEVAADEERGKEKAKEIRNYRRFVGQWERCRAWGKNKNRITMGRKVCLISGWLKMKRYTRQASNQLTPTTPNKKCDM